MNLNGNQSFNIHSALDGVNPHVMLSGAGKTAGGAKKEQSPSALEQEDTAQIGSKEEKGFVSGNKVTPLFDGPAIFKTAKSMVNSAADKINLEMYDLNDMEMAQSLVDAAKRGVDVKVIVDPTVGNTNKSSPRDEVHSFLKDNGVKLVSFPLTKSSAKIDHVKLLIVDEKKALLGGMNWNTYSRNNHDADIKIEGPAVEYFTDHFAEGWNQSSKKDKLPLYESRTPRKFRGKDIPVKGVRTDGSSDRTISKEILGTLKGAQKSIFMEMYVLSSPRIINELINAHERGVDVRVILDPNAANSGWNPNGKTCKKLREAGIPVKWYMVEPTQRMHGKWVTVDSDEFIIGSANWSQNGLNKNREIGAHVKDKEAASVFEKQFLHDWENMSLEAYPL